MNHAAVSASIEVKGISIDTQTRCAHYYSELDVVAIEFPCCNQFFACHECHTELADHPATPWPAEALNRPAILCGACRTLITIQDYLEGANSCPWCNSGFNPGCKLHRHLYFSF